MDLAASRFFLRNEGSPFYLGRVLTCGIFPMKFGRTLLRHDPVSEPTSSSNQPVLSLGEGQELWRGRSGEHSFIRPKALHDLVENYDLGHADNYHHKKHREETPQEYGVASIQKP